MTKRRFLAAGVVAASVAIGAGAGALLFTPGVSGAASRQQAVAADVADRGGPLGRAFGPGAELEVAARAIGITTDQLRTELQGGTSIAGVAKAHNVDPQTVIDALVADAKARITDLVNNGTFDKNPGGRPVFGGPKQELGVVAATIGISESDLRTALQGGTSIADVAKARNVDPQKVIDAVVNDESKRIDDAVTAGRLTSDQAAKIKSTIKDRVTELVDNPLPTFGTDGPHGGPGGRGPRGPRGPRGGGGSQPSPTAQSA